MELKCLREGQHCAWTTKNADLGKAFALAPLRVLVTWEMDCLETIEPDVVIALVLYMSWVVYRLLMVMSMSRSLV